MSKSTISLILTFTFIICLVVFILSGCTIREPKTSIATEDGTECDHLSRENEMKHENEYSRNVAIKEALRRFEHIENGVSAEEVEEAFLDKGKHQFTIQNNGDIYFCFSYFMGKEYWSKRAAPYYAVYNNDRLHYLLDSPEFEYEYVPYQGALKEIKKPVDPDERITSVFASENLLDVGIEDSFRKRYPKKSSSQNLGPMIGFLNEFSNTATNAKKEDDRKRVRYGRKYNSSKIQIGMNSTDVTDILKTPKHKKVLDGKIVNIYGEDVTFRYYPYHFEWISVEYNNDKVIRVLRRDFVNDDLVGSKILGR